jgi:hypothetical protein
MNPDKPEKKPAPSPSEKSADSGDGENPSKQDEQTAEQWVAGVGAGMKGVSQKLLNQIPPDLREKITEKARTHGPASAAVAVNAAALKTRNFKVKLALKGLGKILQLLDTKTPKK